MKIIVEHGCPGMEGNKNFTAQEIPDVPLTRVSIDLVTGQLICPFVMTGKWPFCTRADNDPAVPPKETRESARQYCRYYLDKTGRSWRDVNGNEVKEIVLDLSI